MYDIKVAVILVNYNTIEHTMECIESIFKSKFEGSLEVIVVDNASNDQCKSIIQHSYLEDKVFVIENSKNYGFAKANNIGIKQAIVNKCTHILVLNNDTVIDENAIQRLYEGYKNHCNIGLATGKILNYYNRNVIWYAGGKLSAIKGDAKVFGFNKKDSIEYSREIICDFASGCCMFGDIELFKNINFPEQYFLYYEDVDFCQMLLKNNRKIIFCPEAIIYHKESVSTKKKSYSYSYYFTRNRFMYIASNYHGHNKLLPMIYTMVWLVKKIVFKELECKGVISGMKDYRRGAVGEKKD